MKRLWLSAGVLLAAMALAVAPWADAGDKKDSEKKGEGGWVQLFNGKDLKGWKTHPADKPSKWRVEDGVLVSGGTTRSHLFSERGDYENFHYRIEAKINDKGNSGQYFRAKFAPSYPPGYEAQINSTFPPDPQRTGSLYNLAKVTKVLVKPDTWFTQEVIADGNHIIIKLNGKKVVDYVDKKNRFTRGHFALQQHDAYRDKSGKVYETVLHVRKVEVKELPPTKADKEEPKKGTVSGTVRYKGKPLPSGVIFFNPPDYKGVRQSPIDEKGSYTVTDVPVGKVRISVFTQKAVLPPPGKTLKGEKLEPKVGLKTPEDYGKVARKYVAIPVRYSVPETSGLTLEVKIGRQEHDIELK